MPPVPAPVATLLEGEGRREGEGRKGGGSADFPLRNPVYTKPFFSEFNQFNLVTEDKQKPEKKTRGLPVCH